MSKFTIYFLLSTSFIGVLIVFLVLPFFSNFTKPNLEKLTSVPMTNGVTGSGSAILLNTIDLSKEAVVLQEMVFRTSVSDEKSTQITQKNPALSDSIKQTLKKAPTFWTKEHNAGVFQDQEFDEEWATKAKAAIYSVLQEVDPSINAHNDSVLIECKTSICSMFMIFDEYEFDYSQVADVFSANMRNKSTQLSAVFSQIRGDRVSQNPVTVEYYFFGDNLDYAKYSPY